MSIFDTFRNWLVAPLMDSVLRERIDAAERYRNYRAGNHRRSLKVRANQHDDNMILNFTGLIIDRSASLLFGKGIAFDMPGDGDTVEQRYIEAVWQANKQAITLQRIALLGGEQGTCYVKLIPESAPWRTEAGDEVMLPRLVVQDPAFVTIETRPDDFEDVLRYIIQYVITGADGGPEARKQVIERDDNVQVDGDGNPVMLGDAFWWIRDYVSSAATQGQWVLTSEERWEYPFAPMIHWQNLPEPIEVYGLPDVTDDVIRLQDQINFAASNINKIIRLYAHPQRWSRGLQGAAEKIEVGPDNMINLTGADAAINQLEPVGDLPGAAQFLLTMRQALFDITQTVDISSMNDRLGALTNFGLRVLYADATAKLGIKRELYGDGILEINRRLLALGGFANTSPGEIIWPDPLPKNEQEQIAALQVDLSTGLVSKQTASQNRGYDWDLEQERMSMERQSEDSLGAALLRNFQQGF